MKRNTALTSTYTNGFDSHGTLTAQSLSKAHRKPLRGVACGVLVAIGISLFSMPSAGSINANKKYVTYKQYALVILDNPKEYKCLNKLYTKESNWRPEAKNGSHYGIPQGKSEYLARVNGYKQIQWGIDYNLNRYGSMCGAWAHWVRYGWH
jgi:hypothetical protein